MRRRVAILLLCCMPIIAGRAALAQKPTLIVVKAGWCKPCQNFAEVYDQSLELRETLNEAFDMRELNWDLLGERAEAMRLGATAIPTFIALRGTRRIAMSQGYAATLDKQTVQQATAELMQDLGIEWPRPHRTAPKNQEPGITAPTPQPLRPAAAGETVDQTARDGVSKLITQTADIGAAQQKTQSTVDGLKHDVGEVRSKIADVHSTVEKSKDQIGTLLRESSNSTTEAISSMADKLRQTFEQNQKPAAGLPTVPDIFETPRATNGPLPPLPNISTEIHPGPTASKWIAVGGWIAKTGLAIVAPEIAIPGSIGLTVAGFALRWLTRRKGSGHRPGIFPGLTASTAQPAGLSRDNAEIQQILSLRQQEQRDPIHDALFGVLFEDEYRAKPDQPIKDAWLSAMDRFNNIAPLSTQQRAVTSTLQKGL